jgi:hypothetical protein
VNNFLRSHKGHTQQQETEVPSYEVIADPIYEEITKEEILDSLTVCEAYAIRKTQAVVPEILSSPQDSEIKNMEECPAYGQHN